MATPSRSRFAAALPLAVVLLAAGLPFVGAPPPAPGGAADAHLRARVPDDQSVPLWMWLHEAFVASPRVVGDRALQGVVGQTNRVDLWYDDPALRVLQAPGGICVRREAPSGAPSAEVARLLVRWPATAGPGGGPAVDADFVVDPGIRRPDGLPLTTLVTARQRELARQLLADLGFDPASLRATWTVEQERHSIGLQDQDGALLTITVSRCTCRQSDSRLAWIELDLELDEPRMLAAGDSGQAALRGVADAVGRAILQRFPMLEVRQGLPYQRGFAELEAQSWLPLRALQAWRLDAQGFKAALLLVVAAGLGGLSLGLAVQRRRRERVRAATA
ncbi:MAG: hypothetical protein AB7O97_16295 [Planctomycetota bacterium]